MKKRKHVAYLRATPVTIRVLIVRNLEYKSWNFIDSQSITKHYSKNGSAHVRRGGTGGPLTTPLFVPNTLLGEMADGAELCECCADNFIVNSKLIKCNSCKNGYHLGCVGIKDSWLKIIVENDNLMWLCDKCKDTQRLGSENEALIELLVNEIREKYEGLKVNTKLLEENNALLRRNNQLLEEKIAIKDKILPNKDVVIQKKNNSKPFSHAVKQSEGKWSKNQENNKINKDNNSSHTKGNDNLQVLREVQLNKMMDIINLAGNRNDTNDIKSDERPFKEVKYKHRPKKRIGTGAVTEGDNKTTFMGEERKVWLHLYRIKKRDGRPGTKAYQTTTRL